jgi:DNA-binding NarL/FixJ family response regulator
MLRGRAVQQATIDDLLRQARAGASGALVLRGEPGIGKTTLLDYSAELAAGDMPVLRAVGVESEAELPFAGLHQLIRPALDHLGALPEPQRLALSAAFGLTSGSAGQDGQVAAGDRFLTGLGALSLLAEIAPVLCLVDDAHWLDRASAEALLFAARRLHRDGIVMIFASRDYQGAFHSPGIMNVPVAGLDPDAAAALLDDRGVAMPPEQRDRLIAGTRGNPLALIELSATATRPLLTDAAPMPATGRVVDAFGHQIRSLPAATRSGLLIAAADDSGDLTLLDRAGLSLASLQPAEERGLVSLGAGTLEFRHPLIRAAVYHGGTHSERIAAHRSLAAACTAPADADRRAWHLAVATTSQDEQVASELELAGDRAVARNGPAAAAADYERAAQLSQDPAARVRRLTLAAEAAIDSGDHQAARDLARRARRDTDDTELIGRLLPVMALADAYDSLMVSAHRRNLEAAAAVAGTDAVQALWLMMGAHAMVRQGPCDRQLFEESVTVLDTPGLPPDFRRSPLAWVIRWNAAVVLDSDTSGFPPLDEVMPQVRDSAGADARALLVATGAACLAGRDDAMADMGGSLVADARARGAIGVLPSGLCQLSWAETMLGRYRDARIGATEGRQLALDLGQGYWADIMCGTLANLAAIEGDEQQCREFAGQVTPPAPESVVATQWAEAALALLDLGYGRTADALARLEAAAASPARHHTNIIRMAPDHVEAAVRLGRPDRAADAVARFSRWAPLVGQPWSTAVQARCQALTASDDDAEQHYQRALRLHERDTRPFDQARTQLVYGEWLRRAKRRRDARAQLLDALRAFESLGARPWADRARTELTATGASVSQSAAPDLLAGLTPQELQIARLAARGLPNRDIAAQLFLSPRTVAYHLYKAYPKLGIASRAELTALV